MDNDGRIVNEFPFRVFLQNFFAALQFAHFRLPRCKPLPTITLILRNNFQNCYRQSYPSNRTQKFYFETKIQRNASRNKIVSKLITKGTTKVNICDWQYDLIRISKRVVEQWYFKWIIEQVSILLRFIAPVKGRLTKLLTYFLMELIIQDSNCLRILTKTGY